MLTDTLKDQYEQTDDGLTEFERWLLTHTPIAGREDDDDTDDDGDDDTDDDDLLDEDADDSDDDDSDDDEDETSSAAELQAKLAESERKRVAAEQAARKAKADARAAAKSKAQESGDIAAIQREHEAEVADLKEQLQEAQDKASTNEFTLDQERRNNRVMKIAGRLNFKDPADALAMLNDDDDTGDDKSCERALRGIAKTKPYLIDKKKGGLPMNGGGGTRLTMEDIKKMTSEEINARYTEVAEVMAQSGNG